MGDGVDEDTRRQWWEARLDRLEQSYDLKLGNTAEDGDGAGSDFEADSDDESVESGSDDEDSAAAKKKKAAKKKAKAKAKAAKAKKRRSSERDGRAFHFCCASSLRSLSVAQRPVRI